MKKKLLFIVNPISGIGKQKRIEKILKDYLNQDLFDYDIQYTEYIHHGTEIAKEATSSGTYDAIVVVGGDGSVNDVVTGLYGSDVTLGIIPCGSGNGLARNLKIPMNPILAVKLLNQYYTAKIDTISLNHRVFVSIAGIGFDAIVAKKMQDAKHRGLQGYANIILNDYPSSKETEYHLVIDGKEITRKAWFISFANSNQFGFNTTIAPLARLDDGLIDVCIVDKIPLAHLPLTAPLVYLNHFELSQHVEMFKAKEVIVKDNIQEWVNVDGEGECIGNELHFENHPQSLNIICRDPNQKAFILEELEKKIEELKSEISSLRSEN